MKTVTIPLDAPLLGHDGPIREIVLREPRYEDFLALGAPSQPTYLQGGAVMDVENLETIRAYIDRLLQAPATPGLLAQASLADALRIRRALLDFFGDAMRRASTPPSTPSSSTSASPTP